MSTGSEGSIPDELCEESGDDEESLIPPDQEFEEEGEWGDDEPVF